MERRFFLKLFSSLGITSANLNLFDGLFQSGLFAQRFRSTGRGKLTVWADEKNFQDVPVSYFNEIGYVSIARLANAMKFNTYFNEKKQKIVLYLPQNTVVITANNAFLVIDNAVFQMPLQTLWDRKEIYVPLNYFLDILSRKTILMLDYNESAQVLRINSSDINILTAEIAEKKNGTVIRIRTAINFNQNEITADMRYGWLHVDFYGGKLDPDRISKSSLAGIVRSVKTFQFSELSSIAFQLKEEPIGREIINNSERNEVLVILRTEEELSENEMAELREEQNENVSDDTKRRLEEEKRKWMMDVVVIDPGHGGKDPGTVGSGRTYEKDLVLSIALKLGKIIEEEMPDVKVVYTRKTDKFLPLHERTKIANQNKGKVFISIHANASTRKSVSGFETYFLGTEKGERAKDVVLQENSVIEFEEVSARKQYEGIATILASMLQSANMKQSEYLASLVQQNLNAQLRGLKLPNRGVKQGPFLVMVRATMPNILVETGFVSNAYDRKILRTSIHQTKIARGIFDGLKKYKMDYENSI